MARLDHDPCCVVLSFSLVVLFHPKSLLLLAHDSLLAICVPAFYSLDRLILCLYLVLGALEKAWGLKLGQRVAAIRSTGKYVNSEKRRKTLDDMGFVWRVRTVKEKDAAKGLSFDQIYDALVIYRDNVQKNNGPLRIPNNYVVPNCEPWPENVRGLPLGRKLAGIRSKSFLAANPGAKEKLKAVGFQLDGKVAANDARFQIVYDALKRYKDVYGDLLVPQPFVVPDSKEWPEPTWGLRLGARVNAIRSQGTFVNNFPERKNMLEELGFVWVPTSTEKGNRRGRKRNEEKEELEAMMAAAAKVSEEAAVSDDDSDAALDSLLENPFQFDDSDSPEGGGGETLTWGLEGGSRLDEAARLAEEEAQAEEYKEPINLAESLAAATRRAEDVGIIEPFS